MHLRRLQLETRCSMLRTIIDTMGSRGRTPRNFPAWLIVLQPPDLPDATPWSGRVTAVSVPLSQQIQQLEHAHLSLLTDLKARLDSSEIASKRE